MILQENETPLHLAYKYAHKDVINYLAKKSADIDPIQINKVLFSLPCVDAVIYMYNCLYISVSAAKRDTGWPSYCYSFFS